METEEEPSGAPRGLLLSIGLIAILVGGAIAGEFVLNLQPKLSTGTAPAGSVIMPQGVGSNTALTYAPATITLLIGQNNTVTFANKDTATHTVTATDGSFNSGDIKAGQSWTHTFGTAGTYSFYCVYHAWMKGKVVVKSSGATGGGVTVNVPAGTGSNTGLNYSPASTKLVVGVNGTVTFVNRDTVVHTVTASDGSFDSGDISPGASWSHTFSAAGSYSFHCIYHSWMKGTITVLP
jgi:plastocyanin